MCNFFTGKKMTSFSKRKHLLFHTAIAFFGCIIFLFLQDQASADPVYENPKEIPWHISALSVTFDNARDLYVAEKEVIITGGKTRLEADYVEFSNKTKDAFAQGNVILISGEDSISCNAMNINLETEIGTINKGSIFIQKDNFYINGENIRKTGKFTYSAEKGSITSCSGDSPDWKISGRNVKVTIEGYGTARDAVFWAKEIPAAYTPFLIFPVKTKRQTGFLMPGISNSKRKGYQYEQPFFMAISENFDATLYADYMSDRGTKTGVEYRYILDNKSKGSVFFDYLEDSKTDDGTAGTENYSFSGTPQRTNTDRYWFRMKHNQALPNGFSAKLDLDVVSDADYLHEFQDGFSGYRQTKTYLETEYGRSLDEYDQPIRKTRLNVNKSWSAYVLNMDALWYDNVNLRRQDGDDTTLQTLPAVQFDAIRQQLGNSQFYYTLDSEHRSFYREDTTSDLVKGQRTDFYPRVYFPMRLNKIFYFEPSLGARETIWYTDDFTSEDGDSDSLRTRHMADFGAEISTKISRVFNTDNLFAEKIKHEMIPKIQYSFIPDVGQGDLPIFDSLDRIAEQNRITWSLTNFFISRKTFVTPEDKEIRTYRDFAYAQLSQSYDIENQKENHKEPFSDILLTSIINLNEFVAVNMDISWSPYDNDYNIFNIGNTVKDKRGDALAVEYRYERDLLESVYSEIDIALTDQLTAYYTVEKNLEDDRTVRTQAGFILKKECWTVELAAAETKDDSSVGILVTLHGIGEIGNGPKKILVSDPRYQNWRMNL
ncbi:MAG: organic solvent tolerance protein OstA [Desulfobacula sp. GWF2_41_7]|nr:MAG: organic solvent tolerance protein OstA [Desulfobacula sp. GWF2_41_7]